MGYYADVDGTIHPVNDEAAEEILRLLDENGYFEAYRDDMNSPNGVTGKLAIHIWRHDKYWEDEYYEFFDKTRGLIDNGLIECVGEDGEMWCFEKRTRGDEWTERNGRVVYDHGSNAELVAQIIEVFEDFLDDRGIVLHNEEKTDSGDNAANIYGTDYGELQSGVEWVLNEWGLLK